MEEYKYILMAGGTYPKWETPRQLLELNGEPIIARTIRLLRERGVTDIAISSNNDAFEQLGVPVLRHENGYVGIEYDNYKGYWCDGFYPTDVPTCYLFGDVVFSPAAIQTIVQTETDDIEFFGSAPPFSSQYIKPWIEPFGFKVRDTGHLREAIELVKRMDSEGRYNRKPIAWELWNAIDRGYETDPNYIVYTSYIHINDYTCDIDGPNEAVLVEIFAGLTKE